MWKWEGRWEEVGGGRRAIVCICVLICNFKSKRQSQRSVEGAQKKGAGVWARKEAIYMWNGLLEGLRGPTPCEAYIFINMPKNSGSIEMPS